MEELSKSERKELAQKQREEERLAEDRKEKMKKYVIWGVALLLLVYLGYKGVQELFKPLPGIRYEDLGRDHVNDISDATYNSNPPTSGKHFPAWAKPGVYDRLVSDGYLLHSLEHGYIVISYDCTRKVSDTSSRALAWRSFHLLDVSFKRLPRSLRSLAMTNIYAEEVKDQEGADNKPLTKMTVIPSDTKSWVSPDDPPGIEVDLPQEFSSNECKSLVENLKKASDGWERIVIAPRTGMDSPIVLTAWRRMEKLDSMNTNKMKEFIKAYHNKGPEQTME